MLFDFAFTFSSFCGVGEGFKLASSPGFWTVRNGDFLSDDDDDDDKENYKDINNNNQGRLNYNNKNHEKDNYKRDNQNKEDHNVLEEVPVACYMVLGCPLATSSLFIAGV